MIKNIIFDWSGVIKDAISFQLYTVNKMFNQFGIDDLSLEEFKENWEQPYMPFYNKYLPNLTLEEEQVIYKKLILGSPKSKAFPGIVDLIKEFKKNNISMTVLTGDSPGTILEEIKEYGLENMFDDIVTMAHNKGEFVIDLMKRNNFEANNSTIFIGDSNHEIDVGKKVGISTGAVTWGFNTEKKLRARNPDFVIHDMEELKRVILG